MSPSHAGQAADRHVPFLADLGAGDQVQHLLPVDIWVEVEPLQRLAVVIREPLLCTNCGYCMPCPNGVGIPANLGTYNEGLTYDKPDASRGRYGWWHYAFTEQRILDHDPRAALCVQCGECGKKCPQRIPISAWMPVIHEVLGEGKAYVRSL